MTRDAKADARAINTVLWQDWDPIGCGVPEDEYESYVWPLYKLLLEGAGRDQVEAFLEQTARESIGLAARPAKIRVAADKLLALKLG